MNNLQTRFCPMCHNTPQVCQCNPTTIIPADEEQLKRIAKLVEPKKEWVALTDEEYFGLQMKIKTPMISVGDYINAMKMVEAKLKEKNNG